MRRDACVLQGLMDNEQDPGQHQNSRMSEGREGETQR